MSVSEATASDQTGDQPLSRPEFQILRVVSEAPRTLLEVLQAVDGPVLEIFRACEALKGRQWLVFRQGKIRLGALPAELRRAFRVDFHSVLRRFSRIAATMPRATTMFFQEPMLPEDVVARVRFLWERGDLFQRDILVLGDDDLFSIAAGLTGLPRRIVVGEIDERLVRFLDQVAAREQLPLEVFQYDVSEPLPRGWRQFDVFVMDPVETITGFSAWLSRGLAAVRTSGSNLLRADRAGMSAEDLAAI